MMCIQQKRFHQSKTQGGYLNERDSPTKCVPSSPNIVHTCRLTPSSYSLPTSHGLCLMRDMPFRSCTALPPLVCRLTNAPTETLHSNPEDGWAERPPTSGNPSLHLPLLVADAPESVYHGGCLELFHDAHPFPGAYRGGENTGIERASDSCSSREGDLPTAV